MITFFRTQTDGATITKNRTWVQNPGFSNTYTTTSSKTFSYSVKPMNKKICQIRLDFQKFVTQISTKGACTDSFVAKVQRIQMDLQTYVVL